MLGGQPAGQARWQALGRGLCSPGPGLQLLSRRWARSLCLPLGSRSLCSFWVSHVGISRRPGSHSTAVTLIGAQGNSEGAAGQMFLLPPPARAAISLLSETPGDGPTPGFLTWAL